MSDRSPGFGRTLRKWFRRHGRDLPWRRTRDPYAILVSETMLQQTTVAAVVPYFHRWMERFPDVRALARADEGDVLAMWQGLGYYRRARNLHAAAKAAAERGLPRDYEGLRALPGVGDYTAQAVRAFAHDEPVPVLDANIIRVVARLFDIRTPVDSAAGLADVRVRLESLLPARGGCAFISALMDLGSLVCRAGRPDCLLCPVREFCGARNPELLPVKSPPKPLTARVECAAWVGESGGIVLQQCRGRRWHGLWRLPPLEREPAGKPDVTLTYTIVRERVTLRVFRAERAALPATEEPRRVFAPEELASVPLPSPHRRAVGKLRTVQDGPSPRMRKTPSLSR